MSSADETKGDPTEPTAEPQNNNRSDLELTRLIRSAVVGGISGALISMGIS